MQGALKCSADLTQTLYLPHSPMGGSDRRFMTAKAMSRNTYKPSDGTLTPVKAAGALSGMVACIPTRTDSQKSSSNALSPDLGAINVLN